MRSSRRHLAADAWGGVLRTHARLVPVLDGHLREAHGMSLAWYDVLLELQAAPAGRLTMGELGGRVVVSRSRVSRVVDEMTGAGLVRREANPGDGRSAFAVVTRAGRAAFRAAAPGYLRTVEQHLAADLTDAELSTLARLLDRVSPR